MLRWRPLALGLALSLFFVAAADAQQATPSVSPPPSRCRRRRRPLRPRPHRKIRSASRFNRNFRRPRKARADDADAQDRAALAAFYAARIYAPVWVSSNGFNAKAAAVIAEFGKADDWGLDAADFPAIPIVAAAGERRLRPRWPTPRSTLSLTALKYARYARGGRIIDPATQLSSYLDRKPQLLDAQRRDREDRDGERARRLSARAAPASIPQFEKLRQKYLEMRKAAAATAPVKLPNGPQLVPGQERSAGRPAAPAPEGRSAGRHRQAGRRELLRRRAEGRRHGLPEGERHAARRHRRQCDARACSTTSRS